MRHRTKALLVGIVALAAGATAAAQTNLGSVTIGGNTTSAVTVTFASATTPASIAVVTQGNPNLDFTNATGGTCAAGTAYAANAACTVNVEFAPQFAGARYGAVVLEDANGVVATVYLQGTGLGPQVNFLPGTQSSIGSGLAYPEAIAVDASGNVYISDSGNARVLKETLSGGSFTQSTVASATDGGLSEPIGIAVDGAGNVYIADDPRLRVLKETLSAGGYIQSDVVSSGLTETFCLTVDNSGNVYFCQLGNSQVTKETLTANGYTQSMIGTGLSAPSGVAVDGAGNVYIADGAGGAVYKETPSPSGYVQTTLPTSGLNRPDGLAVDGYGNVFIADLGNNRIVKLAPSGNSYTQSTVETGSVNEPVDVAVDGSGNLYIVEAAGCTCVVKVDFSDPPALSFATTVYGAINSDSPQTVTVENAGDVPLSFAIPANGYNPSIAGDFTLNSSGASACQVEDSGTSTEETLAPGASCELPISFAPETAGTFSGSLVLTDNNLDAAAPGYTSQSIALNGTESQATPTITWATPSAIT